MYWWCVKILLLLVLLLPLLGRVMLRPIIRRELSSRWIDQNGIRIAPKKESVPRRPPLRPSSTVLPTTDPREEGETHIVRNTVMYDPTHEIFGRKENDHHLIG